MNNTLDLKDRKILLELDRNARATNSEIAKKVGLSKDSIGYRIKQIEKNKIISGYRTIINISKLGYTQQRVAIQLMDINSKKLFEIVSFLKKEKGVWGVGYNDGEWDVTLLYYSKKSIEFYNFFEKFMNKFRKFMKNKLIGEIMNYQEIERSYLVDGASKSRNVNGINTDIEKIDKTDIDILNSLSKNARIKLIDLGGELGLSSMLVHQRIKRLEKKGIIIGYKADINVLSLGRDYYGVKINLADYSEKEKIREYIYSIPEMTAAIHSINGYDIEFDLELLGTKDYHKIINSLRDKFSTIRDIKSIRAIDYWNIGHKLE